MRRFLSLLTVVLFTSVFGMYAQSLLTAEKGYKVSLTSDKESAGNPLSVTTDREHLLYLIGPFTNKTGKNQAVRLGVELRELSTNESYYHVLSEEKEFYDGLSMAYSSFYPDFIIRNGSYEVRAVCMDLSKDASIKANWEPVAVPSGFTLPQVNIAGEEPLAFFATQPYVGNQRNVAELSDTKLHFSLTTRSAIEKGDLIAFVFEPGIDTSIGGYRLSFSQKEGVTEEYTVEYTKSGSHSADLVAGKTYELYFSFFENRKERVFDCRYNDMKFSVVENGLGIYDTFGDGSLNATSNCSSARKVMLEDGTLIILHDGYKHSISGAEIK